MNIDEKTLLDIKKLLNRIKVQGHISSNATTKDIADKANEILKILNEEHRTSTRFPNMSNDRIIKSSPSERQPYSDKYTKGGMNQKD
jgi:hypothetical protein